MSFLPRLIQPQIEKRLFKNKVIIVYGARQVGKTTLVKRIFDKYNGKKLYLNCELLSVQRGLSAPEAEKLKSYLGESKLIILDEAQKIINIGLILKILIDTYPDIQIIATGSSSFDLANKINEPLTGRTHTFILYPFSISEIKQQKSRFEIEAKLENILRFGFYPEVFFLSEDDARSRLDEISSNYLYKDILSFEGIKKSSVIVNLLQLLALQLGNEVSYSEIARQLGISRLTVQKYLNLLEQSFVIFSLRSFSRNLRKEISKSVKIYFYDLGIRNSLIQNFNRLEIRSDCGALWENFCIMERIKRNSINRVFANYYFWRTYAQKEIDYIEERDGKLFAFEFKWSDGKKKIPKEFLKTYGDSKFETINRENYWDFAE
ncbi:AAA family ATPase [Patescibacteria group bacterium]|nr:AAA family ATPase [Patescibacteria group bacterium]